MFKSLKAANQVENFRYRVIDDDVWLFDHIHASTTIGRPDNTFGFARFEYTKDFDVFQKNAATQIAQIQKFHGLKVNIYDAERFDVIHHTTLPWFSFTSFRHEKNVGEKASIPKIAFGKFFEHEDKKWLPVSVHVNHGLVDGYHVSKYLELFQMGLNKKL